MPLRAEDKQASCLPDFLGFRIGLLFMGFQPFGKHLSCFDDVFIVRLGKAGGFRNHFIGKAGFAQVCFRHKLRVTAKNNIGSAPGHIRCDCHGTEPARLGYNLCFLLVVLRVQHRMGNAPLFQQRGNIFALFNGNRTHKYRLAFLVTGDNLLNNCMVLPDIVLIDNIGMIQADNRFVCGDLDDIQAVDCLEFFRFRGSCARHTGELAVEAEVVLEGNSGKGFIFLLDIDVFFGFNRLMKPFRIAAAEHQTPGEFIYDDNLAVFYNIVNVALHDAVGFQRLIDMVAERGIFNIGKVFQCESLFCLGDPARRQSCRFSFLIHNIIGIQIFLFFFLFIHRGIDNFFQTVDEYIRLAVKIGTLIALAGNNQRGSRLINQDRVHLVDNGKAVSALHHALLIERHIVTQIVKTHFVVRAVGNVTGIGFLALLRVKVMHNQAD